MSVAQTWLGRLIVRFLQVRIDPVRRVRRAGVALAVERHDPHLVHQRAHVRAAHRKPFQLEHIAQHAGTGKREVQVQLVDAPHHREVRLRHRPRQVVHVRARELQQLGLAAHR
jgi:hypothetical protein